MTGCVSCDEALPDGARFCFSCGATQTPPGCGSCGETLVPGARFCFACGATTSATPVPAGVGGAPTEPVAARRVTSVLFADLVGFTAMSESRDQEDVRELLTRYFDECRQIVTRYGGTVEKFIGDAVMAVWGVPTAHEDDAERAVRAGLELSQRVASLSDLAETGELALRVGIVTGEVAVTLGAQQQGMVAGDAVNTASRVQAAAAAGQVWVDETTRLLTASAITYVDVGSHRLKGKADPMPLWAVRAVVAAVGGAQRADGLEAPLVGRERELRLVKELFHSVEESLRPALLVVDGDAGVGKSRLGWEFEKYIDGLSKTVRWHRGRCIAYGEGVAYFALAEALRGRLRGLGDREHRDTDDDPTALLEAGLVRYVAREAERDWLRPRLGALLGTGSLGTFAKEDLFSAWTTFLQRVGEDEHAVVLLIDDAQHADEGLLQFVEHLLAAGGFPCFVVLLTRPGLLEAHPTLATNRRGTVVHLPTLSQRDIAALLGGLVAGLPDDVRAALVSRSEGVPLFAVETVRSMIDRDLVVPRGGQYVLADAEGLDLATLAAPASLQALIAARLDTLSADQRRVVDRASVIGGSFSRTAVESLCPDVADLEGALTGLVRVQILGQDVDRFSAEFGDYHFVQSVVRQIAYGTLSRRDRRRYHLAAAEHHLSEVAEGEGGEAAAIIAQHYLDALEAVPDAADADGLRLAAGEQLVRAARRARALGSPAEAARHLEAALLRAADDLHRAQIQSELASALNDAGDYVEATEHAARAVDAFVAAGDRVAAGRASAARALGSLNLGEVERASELAEPWWVELTGHPQAEQTLLLLSGVLVSARLRSSQDARDIIEARLRLAERAQDAEAVTDSFLALSTHFAFVGSRTVSLALLENAADQARAGHLPVSLGRALINLTSDYLANDLARACEFGREAVAVATSTGISSWISFAEVNLLLGLQLSGQWDEVRALLDSRRSNVDPVVAGVMASVVEELEEAGFDLRRPDWIEGTTGPGDDVAATTWRQHRAAIALRRQGDLDTAVRLSLDTCESALLLMGLSDDFPAFWLHAGELAVESGSRAVLDRLLAMVEQDTGALSTAMRAHRSRVTALAAVGQDGQSGEAEQAFRDALARYETLGAVPLAARTQADLGRWLVDHGREQDARSLVEAARATYRRLGAETWLAELDDPSPVGAVAKGDR